MHSNGTVVGVAETPWGTSWADLLPSLRPSRNHTALVESVAEQVSIALQRAELNLERMVLGGPCGRGTQSAGDMSVELYALFDNFDAPNYVESYLEPMFSALGGVTDRNPFTNIEKDGLSINFSSAGISVRLFAAGVLYGGAKDLLLPEIPDAISEEERPKKKKGSGGTGTGLMKPRDVHVQTSCAVVRAEFLAGQPPMFKDMVRVGKKWKDSCDFESKANAPGDYLLELVMLEAFQGAPASRPSADTYSTIFRRFLSIMACQAGAGADLAGASDMPKTFISWTTYYNQGAVDYCIAQRMLTPPTVPGDGRALCVLDPTVPFVDVAGSVGDWGEIRRHARDSLAHFQNSEMVEVLQKKLEHFSVSVDETLKGMKTKLAALEKVEASPRRWSGTIQFNDVQMSSEQWTPVHDIELRCMTWRINVRQARSDTTGYSRTVDVSLQVVSLEREEKLPRTIDVDVTFQGKLSQLVFGPTADHVLFARRSEVIRNRAFPVQVTIVA